MYFPPWGSYNYILKSRWCLPSLPCSAKLLFCDLPYYTLRNSKFATVLKDICGTLDVSQPYGPPWPGTGIALPLLKDINTKKPVTS
jgi:hypothetical protein